MRQIIGKWLVSGDDVVEDPASIEIRQMIESRMVKISSRDAGWTTLYKDANDGTYWELTYPYSGMHGGGPGTLTEISNDEVRGLYADLENRSTATDG